jgi:phage terminase small subunit
VAQKLTAKQEAFIRAYLKCGNASEAYRKSYDASNMKPESIHSKASELLAHGEIKSRIESAQSKACERAGISLSDHLVRLAHLSRVAEGLDQISASVKAEELRGKASGIYTEKVEHSGAVGVRFTFALDRANADDADD